MIRSTSDNKARIVSALLLAALTALVYGRMLGHRFLTTFRGGLRNRLRGSRKR